MSSSVARQRPVRLFLSGPAAGVVGGVEAGTRGGIFRCHHGRYRRHVLRHRADHRWRAADPRRGRDRRLSRARADGRCDGDWFRRRFDRLDRRRRVAQGRSAFRGSRSGPGVLRPWRNDADGDRCVGRSWALSIPRTSPAARCRLQPELAFEAIDRVVARPLGMTVEQAAIGIHRVLNAQMAEAIRLVSIGRGIDPRGYALLPLGGGGPMHACALADDLGITSIVVPAHPGVLSASGLLGAPVAHEVATAFPCPLGVAGSRTRWPSALRALDEAMRRADAAGRHRMPRRSRILPMSAISASRIICR